MLVRKLCMMMHVRGSDLYKEVLQIDVPSTTHTTSSMIQGDMSRSSCQKSTLNTCCYVYHGTSIPSSADSMGFCRLRFHVFKAAHQRGVPCASGAGLELSTFVKEAAPSSRDGPDNVYTVRIEMKRIDMPRCVCTWDRWRVRSCMVDCCAWSTMCRGSCNLYGIVRRRSCVEVRRKQAQAALSATCCGHV